MLDIGWIYQSNFNQKVGFRELIIMLSNSPYESVFKTQMVIILFERFQKRFKREIVKFVFIPFAFYAICSLIFNTRYTAWTMRGYDSVDYAIATTLGIMMIIVSLYFLYFEFYQAIRDGYQSYLLDIYNYQYLGLFCLNFYLVYITLTNGDKELTEDERIYILREACFAVILVWLQIFYYARLFPTLSIYVRLVKTTMSDMIYFFFFFLLMLLMFANAQVILDAARWPEEHIY